MFADITSQGVLFIQGTETRFQIEPSPDGVSIVEYPEGKEVASFITQADAESAYDSVPLGFTLIDLRKFFKERSHGN